MTTPRVERKPDARIGLVGSSIKPGSVIVTCEGVTPDAVIGLQPDVVGARRDRADKGQARQARNRIPLVGGDRRPVVGHRAIGLISPLRPAEPNPIFGDARPPGTEKMLLSGTDCPAVTVWLVAVTTGAGIPGSVIVTCEVLLQTPL